MLAIYYMGAYTGSFDYVEITGLHKLTASKAARERGLACNEVDVERFLEIGASMKNLLSM